MHEISNKKDKEKQAVPMKVRNLELLPDNNGNTHAQGHVKYMVRQAGAAREINKLKQKDMEIRRQQELYKMQKTGEALPTGDREKSSLLFKHDKPVEKGLQTNFDVLSPMYGDARGSTFRQTANESVGPSLSPLSPQIANIEIVAQRVGPNGVLEETRVTPTSPLQESNEKMNEKYGAEP